MLSGVFEVLMALALVLSSLLYVDIFSITGILSFGDNSRGPASRFGEKP